MKSMILILLLVLAVQAHAADPYKWRDAAGQVHYTDQPPPPGAKDVERPSTRGNLIESDTLPYETRLVARKYPVTLYSFEGCGPACSSAQALLEKRGVPFTLRNGESDKAALKKLTGDYEIPVLVVGNQPPLKGFQESRWAELLDLAGYPNSNPLGQLQKKSAGTAPAKEIEP
ncbi:hypothetical protein GALL_379830 [mine drainage metagenome]|uniref:Uncharacterized protein n=1 Tax=mine drainage metagenome TaxID=410659 RepID=A0A1J5Q9C3_9ZZZZ